MDSQYEYYYRLELIDGNSVIDSWEFSTLPETLSLAPSILDTAFGWVLTEVEFEWFEDELTGDWVDPETAWNLVN